LASFRVLYDLFKIVERHLNIVRGKGLSRNLTLEKITDFVKNGEKRNFHKDQLA
jgi:hypothetical protein